MSDTELPYRNNLDPVDMWVLRNKYSVPIEGPFFTKDEALAKRDIYYAQDPTYVTYVNQLQEWDLVPITPPKRSKLQKDSNEEHVTDAWGNKLKAEGATVVVVPEVAL